jgi:hypothetical protein
MWAAMAATALLSGCDIAAEVSGAPLTPPATPGVGSPLPRMPILSVQGTSLLRSGAAFVPHGVSLVGLEAPYLTLRGPYLAARDAFGPDELAAARGFGADTVRFVVGQATLTPPYGTAGAAFRRSLLNAVVNARALGFIVIIALDGSVVGGEPAALPLPTPATLATWEQLAPDFAGDLGVALELFRSPAPAASLEEWRVWAHGGNTGGDTAQVVGVQDLIDGIRAAGVRNVVIADGLDHGHTLDGVPLLTDPAGALVYGVEPYPRGGDNAGTWRADFGDLDRVEPVLATEWDAPSASPPFADVPQTCDPTTPASTASLLDYLAAARIGVIGYAFDLPGTLVRDFTWAETSYDSLVCGQGGDGPGQLLFADFRRPS